MPKIKSALHFGMSGSLFSDVEKRNTEECKELRKKWCKCVTEHGEMISQEVKTNPRYNSINLS